MTAVRTKEALRDAFRDVASGAGWTTTFALLFTTLAGGLAIAANIDSVRAITDARSYVASGAATYVLKADDRIDGTACDAIGAQRNVIASGALREHPEPIVSAALPQTPLALFEATPGFRGVLSHSGNTALPGVSLSNDAARSLGLSAGDRLDTVSGSTTMNASFDYPDDGRDSFLAFSAIEVVVDSPMTFDACWATIWPEDETAVAALSRTVSTTGSESADRPSLAQLNQSKGSHFSSGAQFEHSLAAALATVVGAALGAAFVLRRRLAIASDRHIGVDRLAQVISQLTQTVTWTLVGSIASIALALALIRVEDGDLVPLLLRSALVLAAASLSSLSASAVCTCLVSERALFRYFKGR